MTPAYSALTVLAIVLGGYLLLTRIVRRVYRVPRRVGSRSPGELGLPHRSVSIPTENGKTLFAWYVPPPQHGASAPAVAVMHGWGGSAELMLPFAALLHRAGYASLLIDARNHGRSDADTFSSMPRFAEDLGHGFDWLAARPEIDSARIALLGHSVGAGAALLLASRRQGVAAVVSIAAFSHPEKMMRRQMQAHHIPYLPFGWAVLRYIEKTIGSDLDAIAPVNTIQHIRCPVLLVHGRADRSVPATDGEAIYARRPHQQVQLLTLEEADHDSEEHIETHGEALITFLQGVFRHSANG